MAGVVERNSPVSVESCASEPIQIIGHIQSHGILFALSEPALVVQQVSANVKELLGILPADVLGVSLRTVFGPHQFEIFRSRLANGDLTPASSLRVSLGAAAIEMNCVAHRHDDVLIVECELVKGAHWTERADLAANVQILLERMEQANTILDYCQVAAREIQRLSGFDHVMIYRFDPDFDGEVIAETGGIAEPGSAEKPKYLGLHFPATDMPAQARELFLRNPLRAIADVQSEQIPIVRAIGPRTHRPLDMTYTFLRSASAIHLEYLRNMGVRASMAISIVVKGRLWGIVACHHHTPRAVDCSTRAISEMIARNLALQISLRDAETEQRSHLTTSELLEDYAEHLEATNAPIDAQSFAGKEFLDLFDADGLVSRLGGVVAQQGITAPHASLLPIIERLKARAVRGVAISDRLSSLDASAQAYAAMTSGALYIGINERTDEYLLFVRRELVETVKWAGNPDKAVNTDAAGKLRPRASFDAWLETARGRARPWGNLELDSARALRAQVRHSQGARKLRAMEKSQQ